MSRLKLPKPGFGMRWAPPSAQGIILLVESALADESWVRSLDESLQQLIGDEKYLFVAAALLMPGRNVFGRVVVASTSRLIFIDPETGQHLEFPWDRVCRFDVSPSPKTGFDTVGFVWYTGAEAIEDRVASGERLRPDEVDAAYFYTIRAPTFCGFCIESLSERGVPPRIHGVPPVI